MHPALTGAHGSPACWVWPPGPSAWGMHSPSPLFSSHHLTPQVVFLEKRVSELEKDTAANGEQHSRLRQENLQLVHR